MELKAGSTLQGGKYRIKKVLGKGGFGITYLAYQQGLNRYVAVKEFFMRDYCNREESTCAVSIPSVGSKEVVEKYKSKFVKEAQTIAELDNAHIVPIYDVFEENETAYYVMKHIGGGSLSALVEKGGAMPLDLAMSYVRQVAEALAYCHERNIAHLDVKPGNILIQDGVAVLIDFGISKHYNDSGEQTSSTPVGISKGYAPLEQYKKGGVTTFSPVTDIYSLGAVLFRLVTGQTPPDADEVNEEGLPEFPSDIPQYVQDAITAAMQPKKKDRPQSVDDLLAMLVEPTVEDIDEDDSEDTELEDEESEDTEVTDDVDPSEVKTVVPRNKKLLYGVVGGLLAAVVAVLCILWGISSSAKRELAESDQTQYLSLISSADSLSRNESSLPEAMALYDSAAVYEIQYAATRFSGLFDQDALSSSSRIQVQMATYDSQKYSIGDYYEEDDVRGIVVSVDSSGLHGVIVELYQSSDIFQWCTNDETTVGALSKVDGLYNMKKVRSQDDWERLFPAFAYCAAKGDGWYLPAMEELKNIVSNRSLLNKSLKKVGGHLILPNKHQVGNSCYEWGWYWSSTETNAKFAWRTGWNFDDGTEAGVQNYHKHYGMTVRAVMQF